MELILAEKPSAARNFAKALGGKTGNYAGTEYKITNLRGHVMGLLPPDKQVPTEKVEFYKSSKMRTAISLPERPTTPKISGSIAPIR